MQLHRPGRGLLRVVYSGRSFGEALESRPACRRGLTSGRGGIPLHVHEAALHARAGPCPPAFPMPRRPSTARPARDPGEQRDVLVRRLPRAPSPGDDLPGQAVDGNQQAPAASQVRAIRHDDMPGGGVGFQHRAQAPAPGGPLCGTRDPDGCGDGASSQPRNLASSARPRLDRSRTAPVVLQPGHIQRWRPSRSWPFFFILAPHNPQIRGPVRSCPHYPMKTRSQVRHPDTPTATTSAGIISNNFGPYMPHRAIPKSGRQWFACYARKSTKSLKDSKVSISILSLSS